MKNEVIENHRRLHTDADVNAKDIQERKSDNKQKDDASLIGPGDPSEKPKTEVPPEEKVVEPEAVGE